MATMQIPAAQVAPLANNLLRALRPSDLALLAPHLEEIDLAPGDVLYEPGDEVLQVYFPCEATLLSFRIMLEDGRGVETALVGREGAVAGIVSHGFVPAYCRAEVQSGGPALRMDLGKLEAAKMQSLTLRHLFARYADCLMAQIFQSVACNAAHSVSQRAAKWLIAAIERTGNCNLALTQEELAAMLGVGRSYVSRIVHMLKSEGLVTVQRGRVIVTDLDGLRHLSCGCHASVKHHFDEVLKGVYPDTQIAETA